MRLATIGRLAGLVTVIALGIGCAGTSPALAQLDSREAISLQNQILELRHQIQQNAAGAVGGGNGGGEPVAPPVAANPAAPDAAAADLTPQLLTRVSTLEEQVREMRGQIDQLSNQVQQQNAALTKQVGDLSFALQQAHPGGAEAPAGTSPAAPAPVAKTPTRRTPEMALQQGNAALARRDYAAAEADAREVLSGPKGPRQADAQFLLAQSLAGRRQYQSAAIAYYDVYSRAPRAGRAPDALLGVAASLLALGDRADACQALQKLHAEFAQPTARVRGAAANLRSRASCR